MRPILAIATCVLSSLWTDVLSQQLALEDAVSKSDFVAFVAYNRKTSTAQNSILVTTEVFKGNASYVSLSKSMAYMDDAQEYLFIAKMNEGIVTEVLYPVTLAKELSRNAIDVLTNLPCHDEMVEAKHKNGICTRELVPVCGCDNIEYSNVCEMRKHGIVRYRPGKCR